MKRPVQLFLGLAFALLSIRTTLAQEIDRPVDLVGSHSSDQTLSAFALATDSALNAALQELYLVISGPAGQKRDWNKFRTMFAPDAQMGMVFRNKQGEAVYKRITPEEYIATSGKHLEEKGFFEKAIHNQVEQFGQLVHVWSTYEARQNETDAKPLMRGINSIQFVRIGATYKIASLVWQPESDQFLLPPHYLPAK